MYSAVRKMQHNAVVVLFQPLKRLARQDSITGVLFEQKALQLSAMDRKIVHPGRVAAIPGAVANDGPAFVVADSEPVE
jgi:hypothetical protein